MNSPGYPPPPWPTSRFIASRLRGVEIAFVREGEGGFPLVLLHGWPETKRIWWRNIEPLAEAGFEVIAPDLRGYGDSGLAPDGHYDVATQARDVEALVRGELGHERCVACGGDFGGVVAQDLSLRFEGFVERLVLFNTIPPVLPDSPARGAPRGADGRRLLRAPGARRRRPRGRARHAGQAPPLRGARCTARASGRPPGRSSPTTWTS